jgi:hypothetical protein
MAFGSDGRFYEIPDDLGFDPLYAGRIDGAFEIQGEWQGVELDGIYIGDYKTGKKPTSNVGYPEWPLQLGLYKRGLELTEKIKARGGVIFHLDKFTGIPTVYDYSADIERHTLAGQLLVDFYHVFKQNTIIKKGGVPSVTTILKVLDKPALVQWAANCAVDYIAGKMSTKPSISRYDLLDLLAEAKANFRKVSQTAMDIGTRVHALIENYLVDGKEPTKRELFNAEVKAAWSAFMDMWDALKPEVITVEARIFG